MELIKSLAEENNNKKSRISYMLECDFEYLVALFVCDAYLAMLLSNLGISDDKIGIISSLVSFSFVFQLLALVFVPIIKNTKLFSTIIHGFSQILFGSLFLIPFIPMQIELKRVLVVVIILVAYLGNYSVNSLIYRWGNSFVEPKKRAVFSAKKEMISLLSGAIIQLFAGIVVDYYVGLNDFNGCFLFISISIFVFSFCDLLCLIFMKREKEEIDNKTEIEKEENKESIFKVLITLFKNKSFVKLTIASSLYFIETYICVGFLGTYKNKELSLSMTIIQILSIIGVMSRFVFSIPLGKYSDKTSFIKGSTLGFIITAFGYIFLIVTTPNTWYLLFLFMIFYNIGQGALSGNLHNAVYSYIDEKHFSQAFAIKISISGIVGFLASLVGGNILKNIQNSNNIILGLNIYGQQVLAIISFIVCIIAILFNKFLLEKDKVEMR